MQPSKNQDTYVQDGEEATDLGQSDPERLGNKSDDLVDRFEVSLEHDIDLHWPAEINWSRS